ncbi:MAG: methyltransferase domain-containing protein [Alphaproteobacteria bacterium]|nr:MAG: methyltransferase domain-containing protein [Alphaproteobacteria bacterium]
MFAAALLASLAPAKAQDLDSVTAAALDAAIAGPHRADADKARDIYRHPKETLAFFGFRHDMTVVEIWPGGGWYTDILAPALREKGRLYAAHFDINSYLPFGRRGLGSYLTKLGENPALYGRVLVTALDYPKAGPIAPAGSADLVVTFRNVHNWVSKYFAGVDFASAVFHAAFQALKPGGVLGVVEHRWDDPENEDPLAGNGYMSERRVIALAQAAGFELVARSEINANPKDTRRHPKGVWTLPPRYALGDEDRAKYQAIGESDRMTLKFRKPGP